MTGKELRQVAKKYSLIQAQLSKRRTKNAGNIMDCRLGLGNEPNVIFIIERSERSFKQGQKPEL